jgi:hypothetical protein
MFVDGGVDLPGDMYDDRSHLEDDVYVGEEDSVFGEGLCGPQD